MGAFVNQAIFDEIIPTLDLPKEELLAFVKEVLDRFKKSFMNHKLLSVTLNSLSKYKTSVLLFTGPVFPESRYLYWNFASSSKELLHIAKQACKEKKFPKVTDDQTYIPLPSIR